LSPNRSDRYESIIFQKKKTPDRVRKTREKAMPAGCVVLGGGITIYNTDVRKNQQSVGTSVYAHARKNCLYSPFPPNTLPMPQSNNEISTAVTATDRDVLMK